MKNRLSNNIIKAKHPLFKGDENADEFTLVSLRSSRSVSIELRKISLKQDFLNKSCCKLSLMELWWSLQTRLHFVTENWEHQEWANHLQVGVVGVILCLKDNIGEVGEAIGEDIGRKVMLGLGLWIGRKGDDGMDGGLDDAFEEQ